jgi:signal transduction histidine kinase
MMKRKTSENDTFKPKIEINTKSVEDNIEIRLKDNGTGIPKDKLDKIFNPFFTTKPTGEGTGLGLSLSFDVIQAHGGTIEVDSVVDDYTEFIIKLPKA